MFFKARELSRKFDFDQWSVIYVHNKPTHILILLQESEEQISKNQGACEKVKNIKLWRLKIYANSQVA